MKKTAIYSLLALGAMFTACDEVEKMTGEPTINPELPAYDISQLKVSATLDGGSTVNLPALNEAGKDVNVLGLVSTGDLPEGYTIHFTYQVATEESFADATTLPVTMTEEGAGYVTTAELEKIYEDHFGLSDNPETFYGRAFAYAQNESNNVVKLGDSYANVKFTLVPDPVFVLYTPGNSNGWNQVNSQQIGFINGKYIGFAYLNGEFKFTNQPDWNGTNYGAAGESKTEVNGGVLTISGELTTDGSAGNLNAPEEGLYYIEVNTEEMSYKLVKINVFGFIGGFNDWGGDVELTPSDNFLVWTGTLTLPAEGEWKIRANNDWKISLGGPLDDLSVANGPNIVSAAGTYSVTVDLSKLPYTAVMTSK